MLGPDPEQSTPPTGGPITRDRGIVAWLLRALDAAGCSETADRLRLGDAARRIAEGPEALEDCCVGAPVRLCTGDVFKHSNTYWQFVHLINDRGLAVTEPEALPREMVQNLSFYTSLVGISVVRKIRKSR